MRAAHQNPDKVPMNKTPRKTKGTRTPGEEAANKDSSSTPEGVHEEVLNDESLPGDIPGLDQIKELIELVAARDFNEFELQRGGFRLRLQRGLRASAPAASSAEVASTPASVQVAAPPVPAPAPVEESLHIVSSPIVGTYYTAASPASPPFASIGDQVQSGQTLCIIEAMKLMNEIQADASGTVARIFVENGQPVEYGQPLFGLRIE